MFARIGFIRTVFIILFLLICTSVFANAIEKEKIIFISVASKHEPFWGKIHAMARIAAEDLDADLEIIYTNRNHIEAVKIAKEISKRKKKPDYVIVVGKN